MRRPSPSFLSVVSGIGVTSLGLFSDLRWPFWPLDCVLNVLRIANPYGETVGAARLAILGLLLLANSLAWGVPIYVLMVVARRRK